MRWRFVDRVTSLEPWQGITGLKAVSLEEYLLPAPLGREGAFPETLIVECCVELARWLVVVSSAFAHNAVLREAAQFGFAQVADEGTVLELSAQTAGWSDSAITVACTVTRSDDALARGELVLSFLPLAGEAREEMITRWREVHGAT